MKIKVTLVKSPIGYSENQRKVLKSLGLGKMGSSVVHDDTSSIQGMIRKCAHLVAVENVAE
ncbi:LSU ribosomal protein L30P [Desulfitobacterium sp. LBE]|uniref:Large ribosomal subunit protein uL30 n=3 Tax=root TaxID=1 RepID=A0A098AV93_DESHA|nr:MULTISPECIES: 50S ribosomal protein L30 [Desulfitobacterium]EHL07874.1 ribosomal protein L30 [Desulfitobacterium hafniense DP7]KTE92915.1 50S ribosomal protein L30 [Desulfitobacterium hafniense]MEA5023785.1 50S ribosomal protein L30 [Desulfitobacterium hafniense]TWH58567.1 LSU ribosomal protein L30P [Desulfitobacterium sp. LBE]CDX00483.1 rpmD_bact: ribosomal protein L30 [Desulfitobacterium hafniense]